MASHEKYLLESQVCDSYNRHGLVIGTKGAESRRTGIVGRILWK